MTYVRVDVDIDDLLWEMSDREKQSLCADLIRDGYGPEGSLPTEGYHPEEEMYREAVVTLLGMYSRLDPADVARIRELAGE
jgi:hypothetical protein